MHFNGVGLVVTACNDWRGYDVGYGVRSAIWMCVLSGRDFDLKRIRVSNQCLHSAEQRLFQRRSACTYPFSCPWFESFAILRTITIHEARSLVSVPAQICVQENVRLVTYYRSAERTTGNRLSTDFGASIGRRKTQRRDMRYFT